MAGPVGVHEHESIRHGEGFGPARPLDVVRREPIALQEKHVGMRQEPPRTDGLDHRRVVVLDPRAPTNVEHEQPVDRWRRGEAISDGLRQRQQPAIVFEQVVVHGELERQRGTERVEPAPQPVDLTRDHDPVGAEHEPATARMRPSGGHELAKTGVDCGLPALELQLEVRVRGHEGRPRPRIEKTRAGGTAARGAPGAGPIAVVGERQVDPQRAVGVRMVERALGRGRMVERTLGRVRAGRPSERPVRHPAARCAARPDTRPWSLRARRPARGRRRCSSRGPAARACARSDPG